jgi:hypothetical protein
VNDFQHDLFFLEVFKIELFGTFEGVLLLMENFLVEI